MTTARDLTAALRELYPAPVRLSVRRADEPGLFLLRLPSAPAAYAERGLADYLARHLAGGPFAVEATRRRVIGRDVEFAVRVG